jgi:hypothetical protein
MKSLSWNSVFGCFGPFEGTSLYAIRTDAFFHLSLEGSAPRKFAAKNYLYPASIWWRARKAEPFHAASKRNIRYIFICDYAAEPGFGTLRPLLQRFGRESLLITTDAVAQQRSAEAQELGAQVVNLDAALFTAGKGRFAELWGRAERELQPFLSAQQGEMQDRFTRSRRVLKALLVKAYLCREIYRECLASAPGLAAVITHNDFTTSSYLACAAAREFGVASFTLQHGFPTDEYFPISADHYLVWGERFRELMMARGARANALEVAGAPRLDTLLAKRGTKVSRADERLRILFLSQSHSPLFTVEEHRKVLSFLTPVAGNSRYELSVRLHPQEAETRFRQLSGNLRVAIAPKEVPLSEALKNADLVLACNSTAMLEAVALGVPVCQIAPAEVQNRLGIVEVCRKAESPEQLRAVVGSLATAIARRDLVAEQDRLLARYLANFGSATDAAANFIQALTSVQPAAALEAGA